nr:hypothetical protein [Dechloromonas sp.]
MMPGDLVGLTQKAREILRLIERRGLAITRQGHAFRVTGPGVDIAAARLELFSPADFLPKQPHERDGQAPRRRYPG